MKKIIITTVLFLFACIFIVPVDLLALPDNCQTNEKILGFKDDHSFPKTAKARIVYCNEYEEIFVCKIIAAGFPGNKQYKVTLNGWKGRPGNDKLLEYNEWDGEGYVDIDDIQTDKNGVIEHTARFKLNPSVYHIKFFLKQAEKPYKCVMGNDSVKFTIKAPVPIVFDLPEKIEGETRLITGKVADPKNNVYVFINPMKTKKWWVQQIPIVSNKGSWSCLCYFGSKSEGIGEPFQVIALTVKNKDEFKEGQTLSQDTMRNLLEKYQIYGPEITTRIK